MAEFIDPFAAGANLGGQIAASQPDPFGAVAQGGAAAAGPTPLPTADPNELVARKSGWEQFLTKLQTDPFLSQGFLRTGLALLQPPGVGQTPAGQLSSAIGAGLDYTEAQKALAVRRAQGAAELGLKGREAVVKERGAGAEERKAGAAEKTAEAALIRARKDRGAAGGVSARVQEIELLSQSLQESRPDLYSGPGGRAKATLAAQALQRAKSTEDRVQAILQSTLIGNETPEQIDQKTSQAILTVQSIDKLLAKARGVSGGAETTKPSTAGTPKWVYKDGKMIEVK